MATLDIIVKETARVVEIKNPQDELQYTVCMFKGVPELTDDFSANYNVSVFYGDNLSAVCGMTDLTSLDSANEHFDRYVNNYSILVKAQSTPVDDIQLYAEKIGYRRLSSDCCFNCKYCTRVDIHGHELHGKCTPEYYLACTNLSNFTVYENIFSRRPYKPFPHRCAKEMWGYIPPNTGFVGYNCPEPHIHHPSKHFNPAYDEFDPMGRIQDYMFNGRIAPEHQLDVKPMVDFDGICDSYERKS